MPALAGASGLTVRCVGLAGQFIVMVQSRLAFAVVPDRFYGTSFHGFLAKRLLLRGGRLLKRIGVAAVVAAPEISGCGFPAQVAVNALVIDVKLSGHVFRVFIRNVGHRLSFGSCTRAHVTSVGSASSADFLKLVLWKRIDCAIVFGKRLAKVFSKVFSLPA